jgi:archaellum component FlaC
MSIEYEKKKDEIINSLNSFKAKVEEKHEKFKSGLKESVEELAEEYSKLSQYYHWR